MLNDITLDLGFAKETFFVKDYIISNGKNFEFEDTDDVYKAVNSIRYDILHRLKDIHSLLLRLAQSNTDVELEQFRKKFITIVDPQKCTIDFDVMYFENKMLLPTYKLENESKTVLLYLLKNSRTYLCCIENSYEIEEDLD